MSPSTPPAVPDPLDSLRRRVRAMHSLWYQAVEDMDAAKANHVERDGVLPIAFSLFHLANIEDNCRQIVGGPAPIFNSDWAARIGVGISDHGKERSVTEMMAQRIEHYDAFCAYQRQVFTDTEDWLDTLDHDKLAEIVVPRPFPDLLANTFSARVAGEDGLSRLDAIDCFVYQHGIRHMGELEHARALVGLGGMTS